MIYEGYKIILTHYIINSATGEKIKLDEPITIEKLFDHTYGGSPIILNRMFDEMKDYTLNRMVKE